MNKTETKKITTALAANVWGPSKNEILKEAAQASMQYHEQVNRGQDRLPCGFAWVSIRPKYKGNTSPGRIERDQIKALGFSKAHNGTFTL